VTQKTNTASLYK